MRGTGVALTWDYGYFAQVAASHRKLFRQSHGKSGGGFILKYLLVPHNPAVKRDYRVSSVNSRRRNERSQIIGIVLIIAGTAGLVYGGFELHEETHQARSGRSS